MHASHQNPVVIYGAGGHARELLEQMQQDGYSVEALVDDFSNGHSVSGCSVLSFKEAAKRFANSLWFVALGDCHARRLLTQKLKDKDIKLGTFISRHAYVSPSAVISAGCQIFANAIISTSVFLGESVIVNFGSILSHDVALSNYVTISPGVNVAGNVNIDEGTFIGLGASIKNGSTDKKLIIGRNCVIGAGAVVVRNIDSDLTVVGIPAKKIG